MINDPYALLALDWSLVERQEGTSLTREEAWKHAGNPILHEGRKEMCLGLPCYRSVVDTVVAEGGLWRMWYHVQPWAGSHGASVREPVFHAYAESEDGLDFHPVKVGTVAWKGSRRNNLLEHRGPNGLTLGSILHDPQDREAPYKALAMEQRRIGDVNPGVRARFPERFPDLEKKMAFVKGLARSRDGLHWEWPSGSGLLVDEAIEGPRLSRCPDGGYLIASQMHTPTSTLDGRRVKGFVTYDGERAYRLPGYVFEMADHITRVQGCYASPLWSHGHWAQSHMAMVPARKGPTMVALHGFLYGAPMAETHAQVADIGLAVGNSGYGYQQVWPFVPFLRRGNRGEWDCGLVWQCDMAETRERTLFYYGASSVGNAAGCHYRAGVGYIPCDRYAYRALAVFRDYNAPKARRGEFTLRAQTLPDKPALAINVSHVTRRRTVRVELRDASDRPIPGFAFSDGVPVTAEGLRRPVRWRARNVRSLAGQAVKIAVELQSPDCQFGDQDSPRVYALYTKGNGND